MFKSHVAFVSILALMSSISAMDCEGSPDRQAEGARKVQSSQVIEMLKLKAFPLKTHNERTYEELPTMCWDDLQEVLTELVEATVKDPTYEERNLCYTVLAEDYLRWFDWHEALSDQHCKAPVSLQFQGITHLSGKKENGFHDSLRGISIRNGTLEYQRLRASNAYRFHGGKLDKKLINPDTFYNLIKNAQFTPKELDRGTHQSKEQRPIFVKPELLPNKNIDQTAKKLTELVFSNLRKAMEPFVVLVFNLHPDSPFSAGELLSQLDRHHSFEGLEDRSTLYDDQERRIYLCYRNILGTTVDLHGLTRSEAKDRVTAFVETKHDISDTRTKIIAGRGNHVNANGSRAVIKDQLPGWVAEPELEDMVRACKIDGHNPGMFNVAVEPFKPYVPTAEDKFPPWFYTSGLASSIRSCRASEDEPGAKVVELKLSKYGLKGPRITFYGDEVSVSNVEAVAPKVVKAPEGQKAKVNIVNNNNVVNNNNEPKARAPQAKPGPAKPKVKADNPPKPKTQKVKAKAPKAAPAAKATPKAAPKPAPQGGQKAAPKSGQKGGPKKGNGAAKVKNAGKQGPAKNQKQGGNVPKKKQG